MSQAYARLTIHTLFSTKGRSERLKGERRQRVHAYIAALVNDEFGIARQVGGTADHVHVLLDLRPALALSDCIRKVKSVSSGWLHKTFPGSRDFAWQRGYGAFSVSASLLPRVKEYIVGQPRHHRRRSFEEEFVRLLDRHGVAYDRRYLWQEPGWHDETAGH